MNPADLLGRYLRQYGAASLLADRVCDRVAAVYGCDHLLDDILGAW